MLTEWDGGYEDREWHTNDALVLYRPGDAHSVWALWRAADHQLLCWYVNLEGPWRRTAIGFDSLDHALDIIIEPDLSTWRWKDEEEFDWLSARLGMKRTPMRCGLRAGARSSGCSAGTRRSTPDGNTGCRTRAGRSRRFRTGGRRRARNGAAVAGSRRRLGHDRPSAVAGDGKVIIADRRAPALTPSTTPRNTRLDDEANCYLPS
jgi:hypothetical protein